jgi:hypothetical protein
MQYDFYPVRNHFYPVRNHFYPVRNHFYPVRNHFYLYQHSTMEQIHQEATNEKTPPDRLSELAKINSAVAGLVANNPNATPEILTELADREEDFIRKNVAANPNTPTEVLWKLGEEFPQEVLENAVFPLLLLENPNLLEEIPQKTMTSFLKCAVVPISFMEWAIALEWTQKLCLELARNSQTPHAILEVLARSQNKAVALEVQLMVNYAGELQENWQEELHRLTNRINVFSGEQLDRWQDIADSYFFHILAAIGLVPEFVFESLAKHKAIEFRCLVASIPSLPLHLLEKLGKDSDSQVRATVGQNPSASPELLKLLALDESIEVRTSVAQNPNAPAYLLEEAFQKPGFSKKPGFSTLAPEVLLAVASNSNTPKAVLEKLERSQLKDDPKLKISLAANPNTPVEILEQLEREEGDAVGDRLACNPSTPKHLLEKFASSKREQTRELLASNPQLPESAIQQLVEDKNYYVRKAIAANERAPFELTLKFWRDSKFYKIPSGAAANALGKGFFKFMSSDSQNVFNCFASLPKHSPKQCSDFFADFTKATKKIVSRYLKEKPEGLPILLELIIDKPRGRELARTIAFWHPQMPAKVLAEHGRSLLWLERCAIAQNPNTPIETLQLLAADGNRIVRAAAKDNLERRLNTSI